MCVKVCASVSARVWVRCAFNSFGMIMRKIKHTPHRPCTRIWSVETRQASVSRFSFRLSAISDRQMERTREQEALSMLFMCHALLTHLICLKRTTLKHTLTHTHINLWGLTTHTRLGQRFIALRQRVVDELWIQQHDHKKETWKSNFYASTNKWKSIK